MWRNRITEQNQNGREEIAQIIEEHIDFMTRRYGETGSVFKSIVTKIGFFPYMEYFEKVLIGVYYKEKVCETDAVCRNDDELTLCLAKEL